MTTKEKLIPISEVKKMIDEIDTEKYQGEFCFKAKSMLKELKQKLGIK